MTSQQRPRRQPGLLPEGRPLATITASLLLLSLAFITDSVGITGSVGAFHPESEAGKLEPRSYFDTPRTDGLSEPADLLPDWYNTWRVVLHTQIDGLFTAVEQRAAAREDAAAAGSPPPRAAVDDGLGFKIAIIGDSTIRMQANMLAWLLRRRIAGDGRKQCYDDAFRDDTNLVNLRCTGGDRGVEEDGIQPEDNSFVLSLHYTKVFNECMIHDIVDADFVYFGCGLHFLQLVPERPLKPIHLDSWVHYEGILEQAVSFIRSGGGNPGNRVPIGEAFMTTHSFAVERLEDEYDTRVREYAERNETVLAACRAVANSVDLIHVDWPKEYEPEEICTLGCFDDTGVVNLNRRAEAVMDRLNVPMVQSYDITKGQAWATPPQDGRHYPALIPMELSSILSEITTALRRERRTTAG